MFTRARCLWLAPVFLAAAVAHPSLARAAGVDFWNLADARADLAEETAHGRALADRDADILRRIAIKEELIEALLAGRLDLPETAARFLELNEGEPAYLETIRAAYPGATDLERSARNVVSYAAHRVDDPSARAAVERRLAAELARMCDAR